MSGQKKQIDNNFESICQFRISNHKLTNVLAMNFSSLQEIYVDYIFFFISSKKFLRTLLIISCLFCIIKQHSPKHFKRQKGKSLVTKFPVICKSEKKKENDQKTINISSSKKKFFFFEEERKTPLLFIISEIMASISKYSLLIFILCFSAIVPCLKANSGINVQMDEFMEKRAEQALEESVKAYNPNPEDVTFNFNEQVGE